ncbi:hypothetical protein STEG23_037609, partial [Scotinomys teguina]
KKMNVIKTPRGICKLTWFDPALELSWVKNRTGQGLEVLKSSHSTLLSPAALGSMCTLAAGSGLSTQGLPIADQCERTQAESHEIFPLSLFFAFSGDKDYKTLQCVPKEDYKTLQCVPKEDYKTLQCVPKEDYKTLQCVPKEDYKTLQCVPKEDYKTRQCVPTDLATLTSGQEAPM